MPNKSKLTPKQIKDWQGFFDEIDGKIGPAEPDNINIAHAVQETIKLFGFEEGAEHAAFRAEYAFHMEDSEDWKEVERIIRERIAEQKH